MNKVLIAMCAVVLFVHAGMSYAQEAVSNTEAGRVSAPGEPVTLGNKTIFTLKGVHGYSAQERARTISSRIKSIAENPHIDATSITTMGYQQPMTLVNAGNELLMTVFEEDAQDQGISQQELAAQWSKELRAAIEDYRQERSLKGIIAGTVKALIATLILIIALLVLYKGYHKLVAFMQEWIGRKKISLHIQSFELVKAERIGVFFSGILRTIRLIFVLVIVYAYVHIVLSSFSWTSAYADQILHFVIRPFQVIGEAIWAQVPNLFFAAIIFLLAFYITRLLRLFFAEIEKGAITLQNFYPEWAPPSYRICRTLIAVIALVMAFPYIPGSNSPAFKGISIFIGVLFSLGSTSAISNILAGYSLIYRRVFKVGDRVKIADFMGDVVEMRLQVTHLRTIKNEEIVVPNSMIINSHVINYSTLASRKGLILHTSVTIGYDAPWRQVHALLLMAAEKTPGLLREPAPFVLQTSLDDFYVAYEVNVYCNTPLEMAKIYSDLHKNIQDAFNEYGVQIMSPSYRFDPDRPKVVPKDQWYAAPAEPPDAEHRKD